MIYIADMYRGIIQERAVDDGRARTCAQKIEQYQLDKVVTATAGSGG